MHRPVSDIASAVLASLQDASGDAIVVTDPYGIVLSWNPGATKLYGYDADEMIGRSLSALWPETQALNLAGQLQRIREGHGVEQFEAICVRKDRRSVDVSATLSPVRDSSGVVIAMLSVARDLRAQKRSEEALSGSEARWSALLDSAVDGIVVIDARGRIEAFNRAAERLFGYSQHEVLGRSVTMLMPSPYRDEHDGYLARYQREGQARIIGIGREVTGLRRDGSTFPLHLAVGEMALGGERRFTGILRDLTARVELEHQLRASEARWRSVIDSAVDAIIVIDVQGHIESVNPAGERLFGYAADEIVGRNVSVLMPSPYREEHDSYLERYTRTGEPRIIGIGREVTGRRKDGTTFPVHLSVGEMALGGQRRFTGILHDLSERARLEEQLREQAALARLGEMAAVIAHEVKNPLAGIRGAIQVIGARLAPDSTERSVTREIVTRIDALNALMKDMLVFARPPRPNLAPVALPPLISTTAELVMADPALEGVSIRVEGDMPPIKADAALLKIVFENLLVNAAQAMKGQGTIAISVSATTRDCSIVIQDSGPGIPQDVRDKIFTPFFTTKTRGTGLGLPTAKRLVEAHRGTIAIDCPAGGGTTVLIGLPLHP